MILFHAGYEWASGGFVGVDVFFVISGFLITQLIFEDLKQSRFSLLNFYERRARRILPALFFVLTATSLTASLVMLPEARQGYGEALISVITFCSNIYFWLGSGYFAMNQAENTLLHTWSLSVEEQFYVFFPLFLGFLYTFCRQYLLPALILMVVLSLAAAIATTMVQVSPGISSAAFFLLPTRLWELGVGAIIAYLTTFKSFTFGEKSDFFMSYVGLICITIAIVLFDGNTPYPSLFTVVPVAGAGLLLISQKRTIVRKLLEARFFVSVGLISYSAYLWHQPVFAITHILLLENIVSNIRILAIISTFLIAYLSYRYVEEPFRDRVIFSTRNMTIILVTWAILLLFLGLALSGGGAERGASSAYHDLRISSEWGRELNWDYSCRKKYGVDQYCVSNDLMQTPHVLILGDSHANHFYPGFSEQLGGRNEVTMMLGAGGCPPLLGIDMGYNRQQGVNLKCHERMYETLMSIPEFEGVETVYLAFDETGLFDPETHLEDKTGLLSGDLGRHRFVYEAIKRSLDHFGSTGATVVLVEDLPDVTWREFERCVWSKNTFIGCSKSLRTLPQTEAYHAVLDALEADGYQVMRTSSAFASLNLIHSNEATVLYRDSTHLSKEGSRMMAERLFSP